MGTTTTTNFGLVKPDGNEPRSNWPSQWGSSADTIDTEIDQAQDDIVTLNTEMGQLRNHIAAFFHATATGQNSLSTGDAPEVLLAWTLKTGWPAAGNSGISLNVSTGEFTIANAGLYEIHLSTTCGSSVDTVAWTAVFSMYLDPTISAGLITAGSPFASNMLHHVGFSGNNAADGIHLVGCQQITANQKLVLSGDLLSYSAGGGNFSIPGGNVGAEKQLSIRRLQ